MSAEKGTPFSPPLEFLVDQRGSKLVTTIVSHFTAHYIYLWPQYFPSTTLTMPLPTFDGRAVLYPSTENLRDYLSWRQVDAHINNLYNTTFWMLILRGGRTEKEAERELQVCFCPFVGEMKMMEADGMGGRGRCLGIRMRFCFLSLASIIIMSRRFSRRGAVYTAR